MMAVNYHIPVLLHRSIEGLNIKPGGVYVDLTMGGAGHTAELLKQIGRKGKLYAFDQDPDAEKNVPGDERLVFIHANFRFFINFLRYYKENEVDGIIADLGVSAHHFESSGRGFSYKRNEGLDMRMNPGMKRLAKDIVNEEPEEKLSLIFKTYGELRNARSIAAAIVSGRNRQAIEKVGDLMDAIQDLAPTEAAHKFYARVFQALRIEVNQEMDRLKEMLLQVPKILKPGGRLVVISYHSLEDRLVKNFIRSGNFTGEADKDLLFGITRVPFKMITRKVIVPGEQEVQHNRKARSARMRIAEKV